jgi:nicotinamide-nucleotide amidase
LVDSNSAYVAEKLEQAGVTVTRHHAVGDDLELLVEVFQCISRRADVVVVTGGLGPTTDDLTAEAAARAAGVACVLNPQALAVVEAFFKRRKRMMTESNKKQAMLPEGSKMLDNPIGTAAGFQLTINDCVFFFAPGVPPEMRRMLKNEIIPRIAELQGDDRPLCLIKTISTFGMTESAAGEKVAQLETEFPGIKLGIRAHFPEIHIKLYAYGEDDQAIRKRLESSEAWVMAQIGHRVLSTQGRSLSVVTGDLLREQSATLAIAESCTGGLIAHQITENAGSSDYFLFSGVTYSNAAKVDVLGVSPETLKRCGAVHEETAQEMAAGAKRVSGATFSLATTGIAGPSGGSDDKPVGTVCIGLATPDKLVGRRYFFPFGKRRMNKTVFAATALDLLRRELLGFTIERIQFQGKTQSGNT